jgi:ASC-1-like (ASCH) protein
MECVKAIPVCSKEQIKPGDHITFPGRIYDHHAIVVTVADVTKDQSDSEAFIEIVHATNTSAKATLASLHPFGNKARFTTFVFFFISYEFVAYVIKTTF